MRAALPLLLVLAWGTSADASSANDDVTRTQPMTLPPISLAIDWTKKSSVTNTAATVEVDVMPFLARQPQTDPYITGHYGGPFDAYYKALSELNASYVRFAPVRCCCCTALPPLHPLSPHLKLAPCHVPFCASTHRFTRHMQWCPNPRLVVPELTPSDCTASKPATNWNSTFFDQLMKDFMHAVCGDQAANGECERFSVIQQLSTMPGWMYVKIIIMIKIIIIMKITIIMKKMITLLFVVT